MKIVRIIARLNVGGPARHVVWLTRALQNNENQTALLTGTVPEGEEDMSYFARENAVEPVFIPEMSRELSPKDVVSLWKIYREIRRQKPDVIHTHTAKAGTIGRVAGFFYRWLTLSTLIGKPRAVKFVHTYHGHVFHSYYGASKTKIFLFIEKTLARLATDKIIVISRRQYEEIHEQFGVGEKKQFAVVPLGIDLEPFRDSQVKRNVLREEINAAADEILVGLVGRLTEIKNIPLFLRVAELYKERKNVDSPRIRFVIVGEGHLRASLEKEAETLQIKDVTIFLGNRSDTDVFYAGLDIVALTSLNEGTPLSLIEAMANERAVISTEVGGVVDLLGAAQAEEDGFKICERGVLVDSNDATGFCDGLIRLAKDSQLRTRAGANGKKFVRENYSKERLIHDIQKLYRDLI
ncbi:MAG TPA: glycosyltransferase [Pyrinomonadaceae bacterium]|nr:glycosyltransferase [Pyrinomonadaceae bacterium]